MGRVSDPRNPVKIIYPLPALCFAGVLMFICRLGARRQIGLILRNRLSEKKFDSLFKVDAFPHGDTLNKVFSRLDPAQVQEVVTSMTEALIRKKVLYPWRLLDRYFVIAVDGTGYLSFSERHCQNCLTRTYKDNTIYYHHVLEAKLVTPNGFAFSLMTEFIENKDPAATKQDCELKAFHRLAERLKQRFPRLPILLSLDGLFAEGPVFDICRAYHWRFMIVLKDKDLPSVNAEFAALSPLQNENRLHLRTGRNGETEQNYSWVQDISYVDSKQREHRLTVIECRETKRGKEQKLTTTKYKWVTDLKVSKSNVVALAHHGGRDRWKVENEGFNVQKNGGYGLEHVYTNNMNSAKIFYFLLQIAHTIAQLMDKGSLLKSYFPQGFGSVKNLAFHILEAWRGALLSPEDMEAIQKGSFQIRFNTS
ncbi:MAG: transposase family protein [Candidatus Lindowbacteria bacterium]|nr:transposase family protein [Candidatus Lindowbacteria bacterium]